jgi:hypothetical protein
MTSEFGKFAEGQHLDTNLVLAIPLSNVISKEVRTEEPHVVWGKKVEVVVKAFDSEWQMSMVTKQKTFVKKFVCGLVVVWRSKSCLKFLAIQRFVGNNLLQFGGVCFGGDKGSIAKLMVLFLVVVCV